MSDAPGRELDHLNEDAFRWWRDLFELCHAKMDPVGWSAGDRIPFQLLYRYPMSVTPYPYYAYMDSPVLDSLMCLASVEGHYLESGTNPPRRFVMSARMQHGNWPRVGEISLLGLPTYVYPPVVLPGVVPYLGGAVVELFRDRGNAFAGILHAVKRVLGLPL